MLRCPGTTKTARRRFFAVDSCLPSPLSPLSATQTVQRVELIAMKHGDRPGDRTGAHAGWASSRQDGSRNTDAQALRRAYTTSRQRLMDASSRLSDDPSWFDEGWNLLLSVGFEPLQAALVSLAVAATDSEDPSGSGKDSSSSTPVPPGSPVSSGAGELAEELATPKNGIVSPRRGIPQLKQPKGVFSKTSWTRLYRTVMQMCTRPGPGTFKAVLP